MPPFRPKPFEQKGPGKSGFTISVADGKHGQHVRIGISKAAQEKHFGGVLDTEKDAMKIALSNDQGRNHILELELAEVGDTEAFRLASGIKGSVSIKLQPWGQLSPGKRPAAEMAVIGGKAPMTTNLRLPEYARPQIKKIGQGQSIMP
ncbi:hypothetical protein [Pseudophaeobacter sp. C1-32P7]|uniref:hypothetical protein n=1 Tax=Pseudophaeobacter sp. C1-32P7 TaxID=3098142 RepID=UPI0034D5258C